MNININNLISLFDSYEETRRRHISAINGMIGEELIAELVKHYFNNNNNYCEILNIHPIQMGGRKTLDRWIRVEENNNPIYYQTEIKNWTSYSYGNPHNLQNDVFQFAIEMFSRQWDSNNGQFQDNGVGKVLLMMQPPADNEFTIRPLICYWYPITNASSENEMQCFFQLDCNDENFEHVYVFSASLYLRQLANNNVDTIEIDMGTYTERINLINSFILQ